MDSKLPWARIKPTYHPNKALVGRKTLHKLQQGQLIIISHITVITGVSHLAHLWLSTSMPTINFPSTIIQAMTIQYVSIRFKCCGSTHFQHSLRQCFYRCQLTSRWKYSQILSKSLSPYVTDILFLSPLMYTNPAIHPVPAPHKFVIPQSGPLSVRSKTI